MLGVKIDPWLVLENLFAWMTTPASVQPRAPELVITLEEVTADLFYGRD